MIVYRIDNLLITEDLKVLRTMNNEMDFVAKENEQKLTLPELRTLFAEIGKGLNVLIHASICSTCLKLVEEHEQHRI